MNDLKTYNHRGMLLEKIINNTISYYLKNKIAYFNKKSLNIKFKDVDHKNEQHKLNMAFIASKSTVDYYGLYQGQYISFEAKSTELDTFPLANIKEHQHQHLKLINQFGGWTFYLIFFKKFHRFFLLETTKVEQINKKSISINEMERIAIEMELVFPGIIDFLSCIPY